MPKTKKRWTEKASIYRHFAAMHLDQARKYLHLLEKELEGRPAAVAEGTTDLFVTAPRNLSEIKKHLNNFYRTHTD